MRERYGPRGAIASLILARIIYAVNWLNVGSIFKLMESSLGSNVAGLGAITSSFFLGVGIIQIPAGILAARFGSKRIVILGTLIYSVSTVGISFSTSIPLIIGLRFLVGAGMAFVFAPAVVLVAKFVGKGRAGLGVGLFNSAFNVGGVLGIYGWIVVASLEGWQGSLLMSGVLGLLTAGFVAFLVPDGSSSNGSKVSWAALEKILGNRQLIFLGIGTIGMTAGNTLISSFMVYYLNSSLGISLYVAGIVASLIVVLPIVTAMIGGRLYDRINRPKLLMVSAGLAISTGLLFSSIPSLATAALCSALGGIASGIGFTTSFAWARDLNHESKEYDGLFIAWVNGISLTGNIVPPLVFSAVVGMGGYAGAWLSGAAMCLILMMPLALMKSSRS